MSLASSNLAKSIEYWNELLSLKIFEKTSKSVLLGFSENQTKLELVDIGKNLSNLKVKAHRTANCFSNVPLKSGNYFALGNFL